MSFSVPLKCSSRPSRFARISMKYSIECVHAHSEVTSCTPVFEVINLCAKRNRFKRTVRRLYDGA